MRSNGHNLPGQREHSHKATPVKVTAIERRLGIRFGDPKLLDQAFIHPSYLNELGEDAPHADSYERLEFLGDAVLGAIVAIELFQRHAGLTEGQMTQQRSRVVRTHTLAKIATDLELGAYLKLGRGEESSGGRERESNLAAAVESLIGAVFLDKGFDETRQFVLGVIGKHIDALSPPDDVRDPKSRLQEVAQSLGEQVPTYRVVKAEGPDHARTFEIEVLMNGEPLGSGRGKRKSEAEQEAAREALDVLEDQAAIVALKQKA